MNIWRALRIVERTLSVACMFVAWAGLMGALQPGYNVLFGWIFVLLGYWLNTVIHEAGHALAARLAGWRVAAVVAYPFGLHVPNRLIAFLPGERPRDLAGWMLAVPPERRLATRQRKAWVILGGPLASLVTAIVAFGYTAVVQLMELPPKFDYSIVAVVFGFLAVSCFFATAIPSKRESNCNDGMSLIELGTMIDYPTPMHAVAWIGALRRANVRIRDIPQWMIDEAREAQFEHEAIARWMDSLEVGRVLDTVKPDGLKARRLLDAYRSKHAPSHWLSACDAYLSAVFDADITRATSALGELPPPSDVPELTLAAEAALTMRIGDRPGAHSKLREMMRIVRKNNPFPDATYRDIQRQIKSLTPLS